MYSRMLMSLYNPAIPLLGIYMRDLKTCSHRYLYPSVHSSIIHNSSKLEEPKCSLANEWMIKCYLFIQWNIIHHRKELNSVICYSTSEPWRCYAKQKKLDTKGHLLYDSIYMKCLE